MVFTRLGLGLAVGCTIPFLANDMVYMTIANSFLRPHLRFFIERDKLKRDVAVSTYLLDSYIKDVVGSFFLFFFAIALGLILFTRSLFAVHHVCFLSLVSCHPKRTSRGVQCSGVQCECECT